MVRDDDHADSPLDQKDEEIAATVADDAEAFMDALPHYYRGEVSQAIGAHDRIDQTTNWAITVLVALLSIVFSSPEMPAYLPLIDDLRYPTFRVTTREALSRRLYRIYGLLFAVLGVAWGAKVTLFTPETQWTEAAELSGVPGLIVAGVLAALYLGKFGLAGWPGRRQAKGEIYGKSREPGRTTDVVARTGRERQFRLVDVANREVSAEGEI